MNRRDFLLTGGAVIGATSTLGAGTISEVAPPALADGAADRQSWCDLLHRIARPVLSNLAAGSLQRNFPVEYSPTFDNRNRKVAYLEAFGRLMMGVAPWLALPPDGTAEGRQRAQLIGWAHQATDHAVDPASPDYMLWRETGQTLVDAAYLAQAFLRAPAALWSPLDATTKARVVTEFRGLRRVKPPNNNWFLFQAMVEVFLHWLDEGADLERIEPALATIESWYVGDGWYSDGPRFHMDYYNSYVIHSMLVDVLGTLKAVAERKQQPVEALAARYDRAVSRMRRFAEFIERMISPEGTYPAFGRSITYRTAIFQALEHTALLGKLPEGISAGQVRAGVTAVMKRMFAAPGVFDAAGWLTLGFAGHQPTVADSYSNSGSMYLAALGFVALGLPATHPFWTSPPEDWTARRAWAGQPFKRDYAVDY